jgi:hypothetical protein
MQQNSSTRVLKFNKFFRGLHLGLPLNRRRGGRGEERLGQGEMIMGGRSGKEGIEGREEQMMERRKVMFDRPLLFHPGSTLVDN